MTSDNRASSATRRETSGVRAEGMVTGFLGWGVYPVGGRLTVRSLRNAIFSQGSRQIVSGALPLRPASCPALPSPKHTTAESALRMAQVNANDVRTTE